MMPLLRLICCFGSVFAQGLALPSPAAAQEDPFVALQTNKPGIFSYVRRQEIEALTDVSPAHCVLFLSPDMSFSPLKTELPAATWPYWHCITAEMPKSKAK